MYIDAVVNVDFFGMDAEYW